MKINDDQKIVFSLNQIKAEPGFMILLFARSNEVKGANPNAYDRAHFRLLNEDTNQALDSVKRKSIEMPEGFDENAEEAPPEEGEEPAPRKEPMYLVGRLYKHEDNWRYEGFHYGFLSDRWEKPYEFFGNLYKTSNEELDRRNGEIEAAQQELQAAAEAKKAEAAKSPNKKKGGAKAKNAKDAKKLQQEKEEEERK